MNLDAAPDAVTRKPPRTREPRCATRARARAVPGADAGPALTVFAGRSRGRAATKPCGCGRFVRPAIKRRAECQAESVAARLSLVSPGYSGSFGPAGARACGGQRLTAARYASRIRACRDVEVLPSRLREVAAALKGSTFPRHFRRQPRGSPLGSGLRSRSAGQMSPWGDDCASGREVAA